MSHLRFAVRSHADKVRALYKNAVRELQAYYGYERHIFRYHAVLMRARFDEHKDEVDMIKAQELLRLGEKELEMKRHPQPFRFADSPRGIAWNREGRTPDWVLDTWHPLEKAQYPEYFARREKRKEEHIARWEAKYGKHANTSGH